MFYIITIFLLILVIVMVMYYINCFFLLSIIGFLFESIFFIIIKKPYNSSILYGPWTTVYGLSFFIMDFIYKWLQKYHLPKWLEVILFFLINMILLSALEFLTGELILKILKVRYWNYVNQTFNIDGFICLEASLFWGIASTILYYLLLPKMQNFLHKIPKWVTIICLCLYIFDWIMALIKIWA